ncbi:MULTISPECIES: DUF3108 domain-containing protein [Weeksellaceae]|nr:MULTISPECIES: hypothetical protein [Weeksellaceae]MDV3462939.1 hypothetical protein [Elizabethkingia anophelis]UMQ41742.1 hypothetical protein MKS83_20440 [Chryseobacterium sp. Y16C]WQM38112.1 hypothetical protein U2S95_17305 [Elizabethkingia miricola]
MKKIFFSFSFCICAVLFFGQNKILPGSRSINTKLIKTSNYTMGYYFVKGGNPMEICNYQTEVSTDGDQLLFSSKLIFLKTDKLWTEHIVLDKNTLKPISRKSERETRTFDIKHTNINKGDYFDIATYPLVLCALPLNTGYKAIIPVIDYDSANKDKIQNVNITDVKSNIYNSELTGEHQVWKVSVNEESTGNLYDYFIDKTSRKIYKITVSSKGNNFMLVDKETDSNPLKNKFDKEATLKMVTKGNSVISGEAFAKDDRSGVDNRKLRIDILNVNKKQFAPKGTKVVLLPYTEYFKEWMELNKKQRKIKGAQPILLSEDAKSCILTTEIYNDKGNFEFTNLMEGEYFVYISFNYTDTFSRREVTGTSDVYINGQYAGTQLNTDIFDYAQTGNANFQKIVTIKSNGEIVKIKLKRW